MLKEMEYVYAVYRERSFSRAAKKMFISQPALSKMVMKSERELGVKIFDRSTIPLTITKEGLRYIEQVEKILFVERNIKSYFSDLRELKTGNLSLGGAAYYCSFIFPNMIGHFYRRYPKISIDLLEGNIHELANGLQDETLDLVLETGFNETNGSVKRIFYHNETLILAVPASFAVNQKLVSYQITPEQITSEMFSAPSFPAVPLSFFAESPFITLKPGNDLFNRAKQICYNAGFEMKVSMMFDQVLTSMNVLRESAIGAYFVRSEIVQYLPSQDLCYYKVGDPLSVRPVNFVVKNDRYLSKAARMFIKMAQDRYRSRERA